jgi:hypothetical protein
MVREFSGESHLFAAENAVIGGSRIAAMKIDFTVLVVSVTV